MSGQLIRILFTSGAIGAAFYSESVPAMFIAIIGSVVYWQNHAIEVKLNKLLDYHKIYVTQDDIEAG